MIDTAGKFLERKICRRLERFLGEEGLSDHVFSFRKERSTIDAIELVMDAINGERWLGDDKEYCVIER